MPSAAMWFRTDLRVTDNTALLAACRDRGAGVVGIHILSPGDFRRHDDAACKVQFLLRCLGELSADLARLNIPILIETANTPGEVPELVARLVKKHRCDSLHFNRQYGVNEQKRDALTEEQLAGIAKVQSHHDECILAPGRVLTKEGFVSQIYTPFRKAFLARIDEQGFPEPGSKPRKREARIAKPGAISETLAGFESDIPEDLWPAGEGAANKRLRDFVEKRLARYAVDRDRPDLEGTSRLSPYLALGCISARMCLAAARDADQDALSSDRESGASTWINELIWRDFYKHILYAYPRVSRSRAFKPATERLPWRKDEAQLQAWCAGQTGFPIVDAAMRQLSSTGWMHNRLRMIAAMFLSKDLLLDWRLGERCFMRRLIDGDLAANNGGWQWSASTGTDSVPYFRIFNPESQSRKFDPRGDFIKRFLPELVDLDAKSIHNPPADVRKRLGYPSPIVDHNEARLRAIAAFKKLGR